MVREMRGKVCAVLMGCAVLGACSSGAESTEVAESAVVESESVEAIEESAADSVEEVEADSGDGAVASGWLEGVVESYSGFLVEAAAINDTYFDDLQVDNDLDAAFARWANATADQLDAVVASLADPDDRFSDAATDFVMFLEQTQTSLRSSAAVGLGEAPFGDRVNEVGLAGAAMESGCFDFQAATAIDESLPLIDCAGTRVIPDCSTGFISPGGCSDALQAGQYGVDWARPLTIELREEVVWRTWERETHISPDPENFAFEIYLLAPEVLAPAGSRGLPYDGVPVPDDLGEWLADFPFSVDESGSVDIDGVQASWWTLEYPAEWISDEPHDPGDFFAFTDFDGGAQPYLVIAGTTLVQIPHPDGALFAVAPSFPDVPGSPPPSGIRDWTLSVLQRIDLPDEPTERTSPEPQSEPETDSEENSDLDQPEAFDPENFDPENFDIDDQPASTDAEVARVRTAYGDSGIELDPFYNFFESWPVACNSPEGFAENRVFRATGGGTQGGFIELLEFDDVSGQAAFMGSLEEIQLPCLQFDWEEQPRNEGVPVLINEPGVRVRTNLDRVFHYEAVGELGVAIISAPTEERVDELLLVVGLDD